ncbi:MAG: hypothetical protein V8Q57_09440 [Blautia sp.]
MILLEGNPMIIRDSLKVPYANAWVEEIKTENAMKVEGMALIVLTWKERTKEALCLSR